LPDIRKPLIKGQEKTNDEVKISIKENEMKVNSTSMEPEIKN